MTKNEFEDAIQSAIDAPAKSGTKWRPLEDAFATDEVRGSGVLSNDPAERKTRSRQLVTTRRHPSFDTTDYSRYGVFVLNQATAEKDRNDPDHLDNFVVRDLASSRPAIPPEVALESILVVHNDGNGQLTPRKLLKWGSSPITERYLDWYPHVPVQEFVVAPAADAPATGPATATDVKVALVFAPELPSEDDACPLIGIDEPFQTAVAALLSGKNVILYGPPGSGKTELAEYLCRSLIESPPEHFDFATATSEWTTFDTVGGYLPAPEKAEAGRLEFYKGVVTRALESKRWLIVDEINRADIDKAYGELFTLFSGKSVRLPFRMTVGEESRSIVLGPDLKQPGTYYVPVPKEWRMIGTMNTFDKTSLFQLSFAFMRRFAFVDVGLPRDDDYKALLNEAAISLGFADLYKPVSDYLLPMIEGLFVSGAGKGLGKADLRVGPAIPLDILRYVRQRIEGSDTTTLSPENLKTLASELLLEACEAFLYPQFEGQDKKHDEILASIVSVTTPSADRQSTSAHRLSIWTGYHPIDQASV